MKTKPEFKKKPIYIFILLIFLSAVVIYGKSLFVSDTRGRSSAKVSFKFEGIDQGLNPQGEVFDAQLIRSKPVLEEAIKKLDWDEEKLDIDNLSNNMIVKGIVPKDVMGRIISSRNDDSSEEIDKKMESVKGASYHPTQYEIAISLNKDMNLTPKEANLLIEAIVESYKEYFVSNYKDSQNIEAVINKVDPDRYDYQEYVNLVDSQLQIIKNYLIDKEATSKGYKSPNTGYSFGELISEVELIKDVQLANVKSLLDSFVITKDVEKLEIVYNNMISRMRKENERYKHEAQVLKNLANEYKKDKQVILSSEAVFPEFDKEFNKDLDEDEESLYDRLVNESIMAENRASRINKQIKRYQGLVNNINSKKEEGISLPETSYQEEVKESINHISEQVDYIVDKLNVTVDDYYNDEVFDGSVSLINKARYTSNFRLNLVKDTIKLIAISFIILIIGLIYFIVKRGDKATKHI